jgi:hypothetical protein
MVDAPEQLEDSSDWAPQTVSSRPIARPTSRLQVLERMRSDSCFFEEALSVTPSALQTASLMRMRLL